jgi:dGTPase
VVLLYSAADFRRESEAKRGPDNADQGSSEKTSDSAGRSHFDRDYGRVLHSAAFRRLQGKTQVFPGHESDFFRNRLTHSLEVSQIAEGIAAALNHEHPELNKLPLEDRISPRLCSVASLIHDLGHPPFGHNGEKALDDAMRAHGGFEGNAQSLRIVAHLEKKIRRDDETFGLDLSYRTLAAILKYDKKISRSRRKTAKLMKGYYLTEEALVRNIRQAVVGNKSIGSSRKFKTVECSIMDLADDIAYSTYDLEDCLKAGFLTPSDMLSSSDGLLAEVAKKVGSALGREYAPQGILRVFERLFAGPSVGAGDTQGPLEGFVEHYKAYRDLGRSGYLRTAFSSQLVKEALNSITLTYDNEFPMLSTVDMSPDIRERVEVLKQYTFVSTIFSSRVTIPEFRGYEVVSGIFEALASDRGFLLMPEDVRDSYDRAKGDLDAEMRIVCDFVAGMTDRYAMEFYGRLHSDSAQSMFKPV